MVFAQRGPRPEELAERQAVIQRLKGEEMTGEDVARHLHLTLKNILSRSPEQVRARVEDVLSDLTLRRKLRAAVEQETGKKDQFVINTLALLALDPRMGSDQREKIVEVFRFNSKGQTEWVEGTFSDTVMARIHETPNVSERLAQTGELAPGFRPGYVKTKIDLDRIENFEGTLKRLGLIA